MNRYIGRHRTLFVKALVAELVAFLVQAFSYFIQMKLINTVLEGNIYQLAAQMGTMLVLWVLMTFFAFLGENAMAKLIQIMNNELRGDLSRGIGKMKISEFHERDVGEYLSWYSNDLSQAEQLGFHPYFEFVTYAMQAVVAVVALFVLHWVVAALVVVLSVIMALAPRIFDRKMNEMGGRLSASQDAFLSQIQDILSGFDITKTFDKMFRFVQNMGDASVTYEKSRYRFAFQKNKSSSIVQAMNFAGQLITSFVIFLLAILKVTPIGTVYGSGNLVSMLFTATQGMLTLRVSISASKPFFEKLERFSFTNDGNKNPIYPELPPLPPVQNEILVKDLSYSYGTKPIFNHVNFVFQVGKKYAVSGPSGSGKSTLLRLLLGQAEDYSGSILFDGNDMKNYDSLSVYRYIGYISQNVFLFHTTIHDNITLGDKFDDAELQKALEDSALADDVREMPQGLDTPVGENGSCLSGGQRQRVAIARALLHRKSILLMDEGTSALDQKNAALVQEKLLCNPNITLILVSHHLEEVGYNRFDRVYQIAKSGQ